MRLTLTVALAAALAAGALALPAAARSADRAAAQSPAQPAEEGRYEDALRRMITETAAGSCPADIMGAPLLAACEQQLPQMSAGLAGLGPIESITFVRAEDGGQYGRVETYAVKFSGGQSLNWGIGGEKDGKFDVAYTGG